MKKRHELGVTPLPTAPNSELPESVHESYEEGIRAAGREVGRLLLEQGDIVQASAYFRMLGEVEPVRAALEAYQPFEGEDMQPLIELSFHHGAHPRRGFEWVLQRHGICTAITLLGSALQAGPQFPHGDEARDYCIKALVKSLHEQLMERWRNEITQARRLGRCVATAAAADRWPRLAVRGGQLSYRRVAPQFGGPDVVAHGAGVQS